MCLIGENFENGRLERLGICVWLTTKFWKRQVSQVCRTFCSDRRKVLQTFERFSFSFAKLWKRGEFARAAIVIESIQSLLPSTGNVIVFFNWKPRFRQDESETCCFEEFRVWLGTVFPPSPWSLLFSEYGRFGITNQIRSYMVIFVKVDWVEQWKNTSSVLPNYSV